MWQAVLGKFLAAWIFIGIALALTFPIWITVNYLGDPDNGAAFAGYIGAFIMAGAFLAVGSCMSALTNNQVIAFVLAFVVCCTVRRWPATRWSPTGRGHCSPASPRGSSGDRACAKASSPSARCSPTASPALSFLTHFENIMKGVLDLRDILYFALVIVFFLLASTVLLDARKIKVAT